ncbi:hypothetical protein [Bacteroides sp.]
MRIDEKNSRHIYAEEGKVLCRISDRVVFGNELWLGYTYYLGGDLLPEPLWELPEHYEEVEEPVTDDTVVLSDEVVLEDEVQEEPEEDMPEPRKVTIADYKALEAEVQEMKKMLNL